MVSVLTDHDYMAKKSFSKLGVETHATKITVYHVEMTPLSSQPQNLLSEEYQSHSPCQTYKLKTLEGKTLNDLFDRQVVDSTE